MNDDIANAHRYPHLSLGGPIQIDFPKIQQSFDSLPEECSLPWNLNCAAELASYIEALIGEIYEDKDDFLTSLARWLEIKPQHLPRQD